MTRRKTMCVIDERGLVAGRFRLKKAKNKIESSECHVQEEIEKILKEEVALNKGGEIKHIEINLQKAFEWCLEDGQSSMSRWKEGITEEGGVVYKKVPFTIEGKIWLFDLYIKKIREPIKIVFLDSDKEVKN